MDKEMSHNSLKTNLFSIGSIGKAFYGFDTFHLVFLS